MTTRKMLPIYPRHVTALDLQFHFENAESSSVKSIEQDFDYDPLEHVITIEYRVKVPESPDPRIKQEYGIDGLRLGQPNSEVWRNFLRPMLEEYPDLEQYM